MRGSVVESSNKFLCYKQACGRELEFAVLCEAVRRVSDVIQTPAFLHLQTDLLIADTNAGRVIFNMQKGLIFCASSIILSNFVYPAL